VAIFSNLCVKDAHAGWNLAIRGANSRYNLLVTGACAIGLGDSMNISEYRDSIAIGYHVSLGKLLLDSN